ncbi:VOC family protein [Salipaludibacillus agaradhaerens]|uniref:VOC family protein n=1 Tax=Salipaludibacillus agaradhaerens TaxID=76935 RepID=A0A9Q4B428_SALAG|nr:VOC family protein [Salipaludibacillus agaradhaerens]MCR6097901.1 VOC family protein [Salipaludibacillus agaradhaerens]MCR6116470.1 VOC family protein [Salipaludibacillus agaradhaerens]
MPFHEASATFISHVHLKVRDLATSMSFYRDILGLSIFSESVTTVSFTGNKKTPFLTIEQAGEYVPRPPRTTGLYHVALLLPSRADLGSFLKHMLDHDYPLQGASDHLVSEAIYMADPDGNGVEVYRDRPSEEWIWQNGRVTMTTDPLNAEAVLDAGKYLPWAGMPSGTVMGHLHLQVADLKQAEHFYCDGLGFNIVSQFGEQALFISSDDYHHHLGLNTWSSKNASSPPENSVGIKSFDVFYPNEASRTKAVERLRSQERPVNHQGNALVVTDPFNNRIRLVI